MCLYVRMLALEWKGRAFIENVNTRCFCRFPATILVDQTVHQYGVSIQSSTKVCENNSETVGYKDLRFGQIVYILVFFNISFSWLLPLDGFQFIFCPVFIANSGKEEWAGFFSLDKERPKLPFNSLSPSYCEVYSCRLLIYRSISKK